MNSPAWAIVDCWRLRQFSPEAPLRQQCTSSACNNWCWSRRPLDSLSNYLFGSSRYSQWLPFSAFADYWNQVELAGVSRIFRRDFKHDWRSNTQYPVYCCLCFYCYSTPAASSCEWDPCLSLKRMNCLRHQLFCGHLNRFGRGLAGSFHYLPDWMFRLLCHTINPLAVHKHVH